MAARRNRLSKATISQILLAGFVLMLLTGTHWPLHSPLPEAPHNIDKLLHFTGYTILAGLLATTWQLSSGILTARHLRWVWCAVGIFGALDELTQIAVGRDCSIGDWLADATGAAVGILTFVWLRRRFAARATDVQ